MTREEAVVVLKTFMENPLFSDVHKAAFNIAIHDIRQRHEWDLSNLILVHKDNIDYSLFAEFKEKLSKWMYHNSESVCGNSMIDIDYLEGHIDEILYEMGVIGEVEDGND